MERRPVGIGFQLHCDNMNNARILFWVRYPFQYLQKPLFVPWRDDTAIQYHIKDSFLAVGLDGSREKNVIVSNRLQYAYYIKTFVTIMISK